jgi:chemotaxis protein methyltransferase CheR
MTTSAARPLFLILSALVEERAGLHYGAADEGVFLERVTARAQEAGFESLLDYYYFLRYDSAGNEEFDLLVEHLVVQETFFFRELEPLQRMVNRFIEPLVRAGVRPRIWSAACATGEEPLTLAMLLADAGLLSSVELIASDISQRALERAQKCRFSKRALRGTNDLPTAARWIREEAGQLWVAPELCRAIDWRRLNLCDSAETRAIGACDLILCRNVLIYFRDETVARVIGHLGQSLRPGGVLLVGVSESLLRFGTSLACEEADRVFYYRRTS